MSVLHLLPVLRWSQELTNSSSFGSSINRLVTYMISITPSPFRHMYYESLSICSCMGMVLSAWPCYHISLRVFDISDCLVHFDTKSDVICLMNLYEWQHDLRFLLVTFIIPFGLKKYRYATVTFSLLNFIMRKNAQF